MPCIISGMNGYLSRPTNVPSGSWIAFSHEKILSGFEPTAMKG
jgi:hypothetical protein